MRKITGRRMSEVECWSQLFWENKSNGWHDCSKKCGKKLPTIFDSRYIEIFDIVNRPNIFFSLYISRIYCIWFEWIELVTDASPPQMKIQSINFGCCNYAFISNRFLSFEYAYILGILFVWPVKDIIVFLIKVHESWAE